MKTNTKEFMIDKDNQGYQILYEKYFFLEGYLKRL